NEIQDRKILSNWKESTNYQEGSYSTRGEQAL
ncbi:unnamed protein product, partial [marine sediment metagenome]